MEEISLVAAFIVNCQMDVQQTIKQQQKEFLQFIDDK
jgi:hypothetical protein